MKMLVFSIILTFSNFAFCSSSYNCKLLSMAKNHRDVLVPSKVILETKIDLKKFDSILFVTDGTTGEVADFSSVLAQETFEKRNDLKNKIIFWVHHMELNGDAWTSLDVAVGTIKRDVIKDFLDDFDVSTEIAAPKKFFVLKSLPNKVALSCRDGSKGNK